MVLQTRRQSTEAYNGLDEKAIEEEIAAQFFGVVFSSESQIRKTVAEASTEERGFLRKIIARLNRFIENIKRNLTMYGVNDKTVKAALMMEISEAEEMARQFEVALNEAAKKEKPTVSDGGGKASRKIETKTNSFSHQLNDWKEGFGKPFGSYNGHFFRLGKTSDVLMKHGAKDAELIMYTDCLLKITGNKHSISLEELAKIPEQLNDPILLFRGSVPNSFVALTEIVDKSENDVIVAVHINKKHNRNVINKIASVYSKSDETGNNKIASYVERQIEEGNLIDASTKKAPIWFTTKGLQLPEVVQTIISANNTVSQNTQSVKNNDMQNSKKYSYAGIGAKTHNIKTLEQAIRLEDVGKATDEEIRQQTGWFRGYDGKWRFELDDSKAVFRTEGDVKLRQNERYRRLEELSDRYNNLNESEQKELSTLEKEFEDDIWSEKYELQDYLDYPALYEAYPQLKHLSVAFEALEPGVYGVFHRNKNMIILKRGADASSIKSSLLHELQHAIQKIEGFAGGSSPGYWSNVPAERKPGTYAQIIAERNKIGDKILESASKKFIDAFRAYNRGELEYSDLEKIGTEDELDLLWAYAVADKQAELRRVNDKSDDDLYFSTAGEIEARDVARRQNLNAEERKHTRPDIDRTYVVFAETASALYDYVGKNAEGIEIYETSDRIKGISYKEKLAIFKENFYKEDSPHYLGRKIAFQHNGKTDYAEIDRFTQKENIEKINPGRLYPADKAKINIGASGDFVTLLENALYDTYKANDNFTKNDAHKKTKEFEYYLKTVYVDNVPFDVVINIRKEISSEGFVYDVKFKKNKELSLLGPQIENINRRPKVQNTRVAENSKKSLTQRDTDVKKKFSKQLTAETEEGIEQITAENETFGEYVDRVLSEISEKIADKRSPGQAKGYGRDAFIDIAREYNVYNYNERGYIRSRYSNNEIAVNIEHVLVGISEGILSARDGLTILSDIQENILSDGYDFENTGVNVAFRQELKNKQIYVSENIYNELLERYGGKKKLRAASFNQLSIKPADDTHKENIKDIYEYLQKEYSELLAGASSEIGMIEDLIVTEREVRPKVSYYSKEYNFGGEMDIKEAATRRAAEILQKAFEVELVDIDIGNQYHQLLAAKRSLEDRKRFYKENLSKAADIRYKKEQKQVRKNGAFCEK